MRFLKKFFVLPAFVLLCGCGNSEKISKFSTAAATAMDGYSLIDYNFSSSYKQFNVELAAVFSDSLNFPQVVYDSTTLKLNKKADQVVESFVHHVQAYLKSLSTLADPSETELTFNPLEKVLDERTLDAKITVTKTELNAIASIANTAARGITGAFREKKLREIMLRENDSLAITLDFLINVVNRDMLRSIANDMGLLQSRFAVLLFNKNIDLAGRIWLRQQYYQYANGLNDKKIKLTLFAKALKDIKDGHAAIAAKFRLKNSGGAEVSALASLYAVTLAKTYNEIKKP